MKKLLLILPAFNEAKVISRVLDGLKKELKKIKGLEKEIVVVDDGSRDQTAKIAQDKKVTVLKHPINRGLGGALGTGIEYARREEADFVVSFDADGQHDPRDVKKILQPLLASQADIVIGQRRIKEMPWDRKALTFLSSVATFVFFGIWSSDAQSGFRAFNKKALQKVKIKTQRMEVSSEFFGEIKKHGLRFKEVPIKVIYTSYSRQKGQKNTNALKILIKLILRLFR